MQLEIKLNDLKRTLKNDFQALHREFQMQKEVIEKLKQAVILAKQNYNQSVKEVDQGLINQLELLGVLEDYQQIQRTYDQQIYETKKVWINLKALAGVRP